MCSWFYDSFNDDCNISQNSYVALTTQLKLTTRSLSSEFDRFTECFSGNSFSLCSSVKNKKTSRKCFSQTKQLRRRHIDTFDAFSNKNMFSDMDEKKKASVKRKSSDYLSKGKTSISDFLAPEDEEDLAIHSKKADELRQWLRSRMAVERGGKTLLLTGPCGAAKTASLRVICDELGIEIVDFDGNSQEYELNYAGDEIWERSALCVFTQFMRSSQLSSIERMSLKHRLLLIEQLPNVFYRDLQLFHNTLREFVLTSRCMIAIVLSNIDSCWDMNPVRLFPDYVLAELSIQHIKFNAITVTNMTKAVKRMFALLNLKAIGENAAAIRDIVNSAKGDIRKAMSMVDFFMADRSVMQQKSIRSKNPRFLTSLNSPSLQMSLSRINNNAESSQNVQVELFHFIGKLMYAKRAELTNERWRRCERKLARSSRWRFARPLPPKDDLDALIGSSFVSGNFLSGYVFEHEPQFAPSVASLSSIASNLCNFDINFNANFETAQLIDKYTLDVAARSAVFHNYHADSTLKTGTRKGLYQFKKPKLKEYVGKCDEIKRTARQIFSSSLMRTSDMETLTLPMLPALKFVCASNLQCDLIKQLRLSFDYTKRGAVDLQISSVQPSPFINESQSNRERFFALQKFGQSGISDGASSADEFSYIIEEVT